MECKLESATACGNPILKGENKMSRKTSILFWLSIGVICIIGSAIAILMFVAVDAFLKTNIINTLGLTGMIISGCVANAVFAALAHQATKMEKGGEHALYRL